MAIKDLKGWDFDNHRWQWMIHGNRIQVTCIELGLLPEQWTKEGSMKAAYEYKMRYMGLLAAKPKFHPHADELNMLIERLQIASDLGIDATSLKQQFEETKKTPADQIPPYDADTLARINAAEAFGLDLSGLDPIAKNALFGSHEIWFERKQQSKRVEIGKTIGETSKRFLEGIQQESRDGTRSADGADNIRRWLGKFTEFAGEMIAVDSIGFDLWERWQRTCKAKSLKMQTDEAKNEYQTSKGFIKWLWKQDLLTPPKNFEDKMRFTRWTKEIETYANSNLKKTLALAGGQLKLHILLMLNAGMTQKDISDLKKDQIDLTKGTITRKRSKTESNPNTPLVCYTLWKTTLAELKKHLSSHPTLALTTKSGEAWVRKSTLENGKLQKADNIATLWFNLKKANPNAKFLRTLKALKKSSASLLRNNPDFSEFHQYFLGHSERTVAGRSYAKLDKAKFQKAIEWLAKQYGVSTTKPSVKRVTVKS